MKLEISFQSFKDQKRQIFIVELELDYTTSWKFPFLILVQKQFHLQILSRITLKLLEIPLLSHTQSSMDTFSSSAKQKAKLFFKWRLETPKCLGKTKEFMMGLTVSSYSRALWEEHKKILLLRKTKTLLSTHIKVYPHTVIWMEF